MIIREKLHWFKMLFIWEGSVLHKILPRLVMLFIISSLIVYFHGSVFSFKIPLNPTPFTLFGIALAIFLGFRNNASYDRFWEARKLWGSLLNDTRSLARQIISFTGISQKINFSTHFINYLIALTYALKHQLRNTDASIDLKKLLPDDYSKQEILNAVYKPIIIMKTMGLLVNNLRLEGKIDTYQQTAIDNNLSKLSDIIGGCERIASTPIPYTYAVLLHRTVYLYCFLLPFGFVDTLGWMTPVIVIFIAYTFIALEAIADEIEEPFGIEANDLALNQMTSMIENTLLEMDGRPMKSYPKYQNHIID